MADKKELIRIKDLAVMFCNIDSPNKWGNYDMTLVTNEKRLEEIIRLGMNEAKKAKFEENIPLTYLDPVSNKQQAVMSGDKPVMVRGYQVPWTPLTENELKENPQLEGLIKLKTSSNFQPLTWIKDGGNTRRVEMEDRVEWRDAIVHIAVSLSSYTTNDSIKGIKLYLNQIMFVKPSGLNIKTSTQECAFD
jgi:hypothetical protein